MLDLDGDGFDLDPGTRVSDAAGFATGEGPDATTGTVYDPVGNVHTSIDARGHATDNLWDRAGRLTHTQGPPVRDADRGRVERPVTETEYDLSGNLTSVADPLGNLTTTAYDEWDRAVRVTANASDRSYDRQNVVRTLYDANGNATFLTSETGFGRRAQTTEYRFNAFNEQTHEILPRPGATTTRSWTTVWDRLGQVEQKVGPSGTKTKLEHDRAGRVIEATLSGAEGVPRERRENTWDKAGNLIEATDAHGTSTYDFDELDRLVLETREEDDDSAAASLALWSVASAYDPGGNRTRVTYPDTGRELVSRYDARNLLTAVEDTRAGDAEPEEPRDPAVPRPLAFSEASLSAFASQDTDRGTVEVEDAGAALRLRGNRWQALDLGGYTVTENTVLSFGFASDALGEIHAIGLDNDDAFDRADDTVSYFRLAGTQDIGTPIGSYAIGSGTARYAIRVGDHTRGTFQKLVFAMDHDTDAPTGESVFRDVRLYEAPPVDRSIRFGPDTVTSFVGEDTEDGTVRFEEFGRSLRLSGNRWQSVEIGDYTLTPDTVLALEFSSDSLGEVHAIGLDTDDDYSHADDRPNLFRLAGTQERAGTGYGSYSIGSGLRGYYIPVGQVTSGTFSKLVFAMDHDVAEPTGSSLFRNVRLFEHTRNADDPTDSYQDTSLFAYDLAGNRVSQVLPNGVETVTAFDALNRVETMTETGPAGLVYDLAYGYDLGGNRLFANEDFGNDAGRKYTSYDYDGLSRLTKEEFTIVGFGDVAGQQVRRYQYDTHGNRTSETNEKVGEPVELTTYRHDDRNRLLWSETNGVRTE